MVKDLRARGAIAFDCIFFFDTIVPTPNQKATRVKIALGFNLVDFWKIDVSVVEYQHIPSIAQVDGTSSCVALQRAKVVPS